MSYLSITGLLLPGDFDHTGCCVSLQLCTQEELVYSVSDGTDQQNLTTYLRQTVRIIGELLIIEGQPQIVVLKVISHAS